MLIYFASYFVLYRCLMPETHRWVCAFVLACVINQFKQFLLNAMIQGGTLVLRKCHVHSRSRRTYPAQHVQRNGEDVGPGDEARAP